MTKIQTIKTKLHEMILSDQFPGGKLPSERELAVLFDSARNTIRMALQELCEQGLIERHRKIGTLIRNSSGNPNKELAGLIVRTEGCPSENCYHHILTEFIDAGYSVQSVSTTPISRRAGAGHLSDKRFYLIVSERVLNRVSTLGAPLQLTRMMNRTEAVPTGHFDEPILGVKRIA